MGPSIFILTKESYFNVKSLEMTQVSTEALIPRG